MTYYGGKELADAFRTVRKNTIRIAQDIPEDKYGFKPTPESRSIAETLAHIATLTMFQMMLHGDRIPIVFKDADGSGIHTTFAYDRAKDAWSWTIDNLDKSGKSSSFAKVTLTRKK